MEEETPLKPENDEAACSGLEYKWARNYSNEKLLDFGKKRLISESCVIAILDEREREARSRWEREK